MISLDKLSGYERERQEVIDNTLALLKGKPAIMSCFTAIAERANHQLSKRLQMNIVHKD